MTIDKLTVENGTHRLAVYGSLDITLDKVGLRHALAPKIILDQAVQVLSADPNLPEQQPPAEKPKTVRNPFAERPKPRNSVQNVKSLGVYTSI